MKPVAILQKPTYDMLTGSSNNQRPSGRTMPQQEIDFLTAFVENSPDAILSRDADKKINSWNKGAENLLGFTKEEAIGKTAKELGIIRFSQDELEELDKTLAETGSWQSEKEYFHKNGNRLSGAVSAHLIKNDPGIPGTVVFIIKDLTRQKELEEALRKNNELLERIVSDKTKGILKMEKRFRAMTENTHEAIAMLDESLNIFYRSPAALRITGWSDEEVQEKGFLHTVIHPEDREKFSDYLQESLSHPGQIIHTGYRLLRKGGEVRYVEGSIVNLLKQEAKAIIVDTRDITERIEQEMEIESAHQKIKDRQNLLNLYIKHSPAAIAMFDNSMKYLVASDRWINDYGLEGMQIIGKSHYDIFPEISEEWKNIHQRCLKGAIEKKEEDSFLRENGILMYLRWEVLPWYEHSGSIGGIIIFTEDITERKIAEEEINRSEEKYRSVVDRISDGFIALNTGWQFTYINKVAEQMFNRPSGYLVGKNIWTEFPDSVNKVFYQAYHQAMKTQKHIHLKEFSVAVNLWVEVNIYPSPSGLSIFFRDITKEKEAEWKARQSDELRKTIMRSALDAIICINREGNITQWNKQAQNLFGWTEDEVLGNNIGDTIVPLQQRKHHREGFDKFRASGKGTILRKLLEVTALKKDGTEFPIELFIVPLAEKEEGACCAFIRDISERKSAEETILKNQERLKLAQSIAHLGHWEVDFETQQSSWSEEAYRIYGVEPGEHNFSEQDWLSFIHPDDLVFVKEQLTKGMDGWKGYSFYHRIIRKDDEVRYVYSEGHYLFNKEGKPRGMYGISHDITDLKKLELELQEQQRKEQIKLTAAVLEAQEKERHSIGAELHDNVNQILVSTKMMLSLISISPEQKDEILLSADKNLQLAITENRKIAHELVGPDFDSESFLEGIQSLTNSMLKKAGIKITINAESFNEQLMSDEQKKVLYRILQEQCTNIVKYSEAKTVTIHLHNNSRMINMVTLDDGKGMDPAVKKEGIGLRNIKSRLSVYEGKMNIKTAPGKGFAMAVSLPI